LVFAPLFGFRAAGAARRAGFALAAGFGAIRALLGERGGVDRAGPLVSQPDKPDALTTARHRLHRH